jgi:hypothetical protein
MSAQGAGWKGSAALFFNDQNTQASEKANNYD